MEKITSSNNNRVVMFSKLNQKKYRDEYGLFLLENYKLIAEVVKRGDEIEQLLIDESKQDKFEKIIQKLYEQTIILPSNIFAKISETVTSQGIIAVMKKRDETSIASLCGRILVLDRIQDAGNVGTLLRSAQGFGFQNVIMIDSADEYSSKVIRSSGGSIFHLNIAHTSEKELLNLIKRSDLAVFTADMNGSSLYETHDFPQNMMLIVGNEGQGVSTALEEASTNNIMIPMEEGLESLNAGVSGSIIMSYIHSKK
ncbi:MAG: RNA methyltransferase [Clostridia bacterium]|nr:RNA methyltransferase [Clostridia bacterium]